MFSKLASLSSSSPVESLLDKEDFTLEELLDEEDIIQECKALNSRLINFLRDRAQVEQLLRYIVEESQEDADSKRTFKFPFIACEIFTCEIDVILKTLVEEEELMNLLFSFIEPSRPHSALLAGYFSKVVVCLILRKAIPLMNYVKAHHNVLQQLVDLIGTTSIMEVLVRLLGADDHLYPNSLDVMQWLSDSNLLEMVVDKLNTSSHPEVHANAAETLCSITRNAASPLASKLSSPSYVAMIFGHALEVEDSHSKSALVHSLSVCISLLDPKRSTPSALLYSFKGQHMYESPVNVNPDTIGAMLPKLGELLMLLNVSSDDKILPTTYGELRPPLGKHRLKIVEFLAVLLKSGNETAEKELVISGTILRVLDLLFEYPFNNALHHHVESIIYSCLKSRSDAIVNHLFLDCKLIEKILQTDKCPTLSGVLNQPSLPASGRRAPRAGYFGHLTRISNKLIQFESCDTRIQTHLQEHNDWREWQATVLQERNMVENVNRWACGRYCESPDLRVTLGLPLGSGRSLSLVEHPYSASEVATPERLRSTRFVSVPVSVVHLHPYTVPSIYHMAPKQLKSYSSANARFTWLNAKKKAEAAARAAAKSPSEALPSGEGGSSLLSKAVSKPSARKKKRAPASQGRSENAPGSEVSGNRCKRVAGVDESASRSPESDPAFEQIEVVAVDRSVEMGPNDLDISPFAPTVHVGLFNSRPTALHDRVRDSDEEDVHGREYDVAALANNLSEAFRYTIYESDDEDSSPKSVPSLFEKDVDFVGLELEGTEKAMEQALKEGTIVGEAGPLKRNATPKKPDKEDSDDGGAGMKEFSSIFKANITLICWLRKIL